MPVQSRSGRGRGGRKPRAYLPKEERREQILEAALACFVRGGYHATHVSDVVDEAGVARGTFYLHFESKHDVFEALVDRMLGVFLGLPKQAWRAARTRDEAHEVLTGAYHRTFSTLRANRHLCRLLLEEAVGIDKGFRARLEEHYAAWNARIGEMLDALVEAGVARADLDRELTGELVVGMVDRVTRRYLLGDEEPDLGRLVRGVVAFELRGVTG